VSSANYMCCVCIYTSMHICIHVCESIQSWRFLYTSKIETRGRTVTYSSAHIRDDVSMAAGLHELMTWLLDCLHLDQSRKLPGSCLIQPLPQLQAAAACWGDGDGVPDHDKHRSEGTFGLKGIRKSKDHLR
jgi:hypothetical protein